MLRLADLTPTDRAEICNGCGPKGWKRHTRRWRIAKLLTPALAEACDAHDLAYWQGGDEADRMIADHNFREEIADIAEHRGFIIGILLEWEQPILFGIVEREGRNFFAYRKEPKTIDDLPSRKAAA